jgi:O-antigen/teichoic acid export membrane protein
MISREFVKDFCVYSLGSVLTQVSNIFLMLFLMYNVPDWQVGLFSLSISTILLLSTIISFGLRQLFMIEFFNLSSAERKQFVNDSIVIYLILSSVFLLGALFGFKTFNAFLFAGHATKSMYVCVMALVFLTFFTELFFQALMYTLRSVQVTFIKSLAAIFILAVSTSAVFFFNAGVETIIFAQLISYFMIVCYAGKQYYSKGLFEHFDAQRSIKKSSVLLRASAPLMPTVIAGLLLASGNRWVLAWHAGLADIAVYSLAEYVSPLFNLLILYPLSGAYLPRIMKAFAEPALWIRLRSPRAAGNAHPEPVEGLAQVEAGNKRLMWQSMATLFVLGSCGYFLLRPLAFYFLPNNYCAAIPGAFVVFIANILLMGTYFTSSILLFKKKSYYLLATMVTAAAVNLMLSYILVPIYGINGCFMSYAVAYLVYFGLMYVGNRVVLRECVAHALAPADIQKRLAYQPAVFLQQEDQVPSNNRKESSSELEDRNF